MFFFILSSCFILPQQQGLIDTSLDFIPDPLILGTYMVYFTFGYMLFSFKNDITAIFSNWKTHLALASGLSVVYFFCFLFSINNPTLVSTGVASLICALLSWLMVFGLFGLFLQKLNQPSAILDLIGRSSYWVYLTHLPVTVLLGALLVNYPAPSFLKFVFIIAVTCLVLLSAYKLFVERTFIGQFLNGKKEKGRRI